MHPLASTAFIGGGTGSGEILVILAALLLLFGSKNLPKIARTLGRTLEEFRRASREVTRELMEADRELERDLDPESSPTGRADASRRSAAPGATPPPGGTVTRASDRPVAPAAETQQEKESPHESA